MYYSIIELPLIYWVVKQLLHVLLLISMLAIKYTLRLYVSLWYLSDCPVQMLHQHQELCALASRLNITWLNMLRKLPCKCWKMNYWCHERCTPVDVWFDQNYQKMELFHSCDSCSRWWEEVIFFIATKFTFWIANSIVSGWLKEYLSICGYIQTTFSSYLLWWILLLKDTGIKVI